MTRKVYVVTGLGPGDDGKGSVVHAVAKSQRAHTVIKRGGAQAGHGVRTSAGQVFTFGQWGCGTFDGIPTHLSSQMVVSPSGLLREAEELRRNHGITDPFAILTVDSSALVATPLHGIASRLFELSLGKRSRGTVGTGVGQAYRDAVARPDLALRVSDLGSPTLRDKLYAVRSYIRSYLDPVIESEGTEFLQGDSAEVRYEVGLLRDDGFVEFIVQQFGEACWALRSTSSIKPPAYLADVVLRRPGNAVIESSHGVLTDNMYGFAPHVSAIRTLPSQAWQLLDNADYTGKIVNLGVTRAYAYRHGAGPLPTGNPTLTEALCPGSSLEDNRYQGKVRVGALDGVLLRYAIDVCGGPQAFDGLAVTWFDQIRANGEWSIADRYDGRLDPAIFTREGRLQVTANPSRLQQETLTAALGEVQPTIVSLPIDPSLDNDASYRACAEQVQSMTDIPVRMVSMGPTERDKLMQ